MTRRPNGYRFSIRHQEKQRMMLRALEEMSTKSETQEESAMIAEMIIELEHLLAARRRGYSYKGYKRRAA